MTCSSCTHENPAGAKFCEECGTPLSIACASCGIALRASVKFCSECGTPVAASGAGSSAAPPAPARHGPPAAMPATPAGTRKIVTIVFADLAGSTAMQERLDPESVRRFMERYYDAMREAVEAQGGSVTQFLGDGVKAVFGIPRVSEDDAIRAVRAGVAMQEAFRALAESQRGAVGAVGLRVAVNTGEVVANADDEIIGDPVNVAARLQEQGGDGDVVIGDATARLVESLVTLSPLGSFELKGRAESVAAFLVDSLDPPASAAAAAFVGRDAELIRLTLVYESAIEKPATSLAILLGSPGLGKSRLIDEFSRRLGESARVVEAHCDQANGATFAPLATALRGLLDIEATANGDANTQAALAAIPEGDRDRERIATGIAALLAGSPGSIEETFFVVRRLFAALASVRPVVLVIDDLQWAEPLLLDLVEHLVQWGSGVPMLVLVGARPELREKRVSLTIPGGLVSDVLTLSGLDAGAAMRLAANVIGADNLPAAVAAKVLATSEGNPLFVGELVRMLVHEGALKREGDRWTTGTALAALEMPPTIHALLAARIERLHPDERSLLEHASIVGRHFSRSSVIALLPASVSRVNEHFETLLRSELIERDAGWFFGEPVLRFHHVLIRDAAYRQLLKGTRAALHTRFADWAFERAEGSAEHDETIGWHLEQAHQLLRELGPIDAAGRAIGERASKHLAAAGTRALAGDDVSLAASLLGRAIERLDPADEARAELALDWCEALLAAGDVGPAVAAIEELDRFVGDSERLRAWHTCFAGQHTVLTAPEGLQSTADEVAGAADRMAELDDPAGEAKAHYVHALALSSLGKIGACEAALDRALAAARRVSGDRRRANTVLAIAPLAALSGPSPVTRASGRCLDVVRVLRITLGAPAVEAVALSCQGVLEALRGRTDAARRMIASARSMVEELGITQRLLEVDVFSGQVDLLEGDAIAAEASLRGAYDGLRELGLGIDAAKAAALLARSLLAQDRDTEAEALSIESEALAGDDLKAAIAWRGVRAEALARRGKHAEAVAFASKAVEMAATTDALLDHADARLALAAALRAAGRIREADTEERRAHELWEAKGATLLAKRAQPGITGPAAVADERVSSAGTTPTPRSCVRPNIATALLARFDLGFAAHDLQTLRNLFHDDYFEIDHPTASTFGRDEAVASMRRLLDSEAPHYQAVPLATLGDCLVLTRRIWGAAGAVSKKFDVGAYENQVIHLMEVDHAGLLVHSQVFSEERMTDAVTCLYERYAQRLPEGPERDRAMAIANSVDVFVGPVDLVRLAESLTPSMNLIDHRVLSTWSSNNGAEMVEHFRQQLELAPDFAPSIDGILGLRPDQLLLRMTYSGHATDSGGYFGNEVLVLYCFGDDGRVPLIEAFEAEDEVSALARFDELTAVHGPVRVSKRRVTPNDATRTAERLDAALAAGDLASVEAMTSASAQFSHHGTALNYGRAEYIGTWRSAFQSDQIESRFDVLGTLGDSLLLGLQRVRVSGMKGRDLEAFGPTEIDETYVGQTDAEGRWSHVDMFHRERLGSAVICLYERYADQFAAGPERRHASVIARSVATVLEAESARALGTAGSPSLQAVDHRILGYGSMHDGAKMLDNLHAMFELEDFAFVVDDVLALLPDALLLRTTTSGTARASGGAYERSMLQIWRFDEAGLLCWLEFFDTDREAEALARFDELTATTATTVDFANGASRAWENLTRSWLERDWQGFSDLLAVAFHFHDRRRLVLVDLDKSEFLESIRFFGEFTSTRIEAELIATRGDRLAMFRECLYLENGDVGPSESAVIRLIETDEAGRVLAELRFDTDDAATAYAELDARFGAGEAAGDPPSWRSIRSFVEFVEARDWEAVASLCTDALVEYDHRSLAVLGTTHGADAWAHNFATLVDLASDTIYRVDHFVPAQRGYYVHGAWSGSQEGGAYEVPLHAVIELDDGGLITRADIYDDSLDAALARLAELSEPASETSPFKNAAWRANERYLSLWLGRDWDGILAMLPEHFRFHDRRRVAQIDLDREQFTSFTRSVGELQSTRATGALLATRGDRLALGRRTITISGGDVGQSEITNLALWEVDEHGNPIAILRYDDADIDAAYAELDARFDAVNDTNATDAIHHTAHPNAWSAVRDFVRGIRERDWEAVAAICHPDVVEHDHRRLAVLGTTRGVEAWVASCRAVVEVAPDTVYRAHHFVPTARGYYIPGGWYGAADGSNYEMSLNPVVELDDDGMVLQIDLYDVGDPAALERLTELGAATSTPAATLNAADSLTEKIIAYWYARSWSEMARLFGPSFRFSDRRRLTHLELDRDGWIEMTRQLADMTTARLQSETIATRGDRLTLRRIVIEVSEGDVGPSVVEHLNLFECNEEGTHFIAGSRYDVDELDTALADLEARSAALASAHSDPAHPDPAAATSAPRNSASIAMDRWIAAYNTGFETGDWEPMRRLCSPGFAFEDRRRMALISGDRELMIASARERAASGARIRLDPMGTAGDRVLMGRVLWSGGPAEGRFEIEYLWLGEVDASGPLIAFVLIDSDDPRALQREAWARWIAIDPHVAAVTAPIGRILEAFNEQDADRWRAQFADDLVLYDHRLAGMGQIRGAEAYTASLVELWTLAPMTHAEVGWVWHAFDRRGGITVVQRTGTVPDGGGDFESEYLYLFLVSDGLITHVEVYETNALDVARTRFDELLQDPVPIPPNLATRSRDDREPAGFRALDLPAVFENAVTRTVAKATAAQGRRDWEGFAATFAANYRNQDRRALAQIESDRESWLDSYREIVEMTTAPPRFQVLATRGERLALVRMLWQGAEGDVGPSEIEWLLVIEVDEQGNHTAVVTFDPTDLDAAHEELDALWSAGIAGLHPRPSGWLDKFRRSFAARDWDAMATLGAEDEIAVNHRLVGWGTLRGTGEWVTTLRALVDLAENTEFRFHHVRTCESGLLARFDFVGTRDGGPYEIPELLVVEVNERGESVRMDVWDDRDLDQAVSRFEALRIDPLRVPPNAATRLLQRIQEMRTHGDIEVVRGVVADDFCFDDRQRRSLITGGVDEWLRALAFLWNETGAQHDVHAVARAGELLALDRVVWTEGAGDGPFEMESLRLTEVDESGKLRTLMLFDADDRAAALAELAERHAATRADGIPQGEIDFRRRGSW